MNRISERTLIRFKKCNIKIDSYKAFRQISSSRNIILTKKHHYIATSVTVLLATTGVAVGGVAYLNKTNRLQLLEYARTHKSELLKDSSWRVCIAIALVDMYRQPSGREIVNRMQCGKTLGRWVADDRWNQPEIMTVLLMLSNADARYLIEAINEAGVEVLDRLYEYNKKECETAIIQMIKQKPRTLIPRAAPLISRLQNHPTDIYTLGLLWLLEGTNVSSVPYTDIPVPQQDIPRSIKIQYAQLLQRIQVVSLPDQSPSLIEKEEGYLRVMINAVRKVYQKRKARVIQADLKEVPQTKDDIALMDSLSNLTKDLDEFEKAFKSSPSSPILSKPIMDTNEDEALPSHLKQWLDCLLDWCQDVDPTITNESLKALYHFTQDYRCACYVARSHSNLLLRLFEETDNNPSVARRRSLSQLIEVISTIPASSSHPYCFDRFEEIYTTHLQMIGDDLIPSAEVDYTCEPHKWMQYITHMCFQHDLIQKLAGIHTLQNFLHNSENREEMAKLWSESLLHLVESQARPALVEESKNYQLRGVKNANNRPWWELRCMIRSLGLFCQEEQLAEVMLSNGLLQYLRALCYHEENSLCVQICRILSDLSFQNNRIGTYTRDIVRHEWLDVLKKWSETGNTKLHFFAEKVLYNCREVNEDQHYLDEPIFILYDGSKDKDRIADIVFIHGLQGSFFSTWMVQQDSTDYHNVTCWPATYLPAYLTQNDQQPPVRILSVAYHARMRKSSSPHPTLGMKEQASDLRSRLESAGIGEKPIIFVTHSMGGLIVKEMLVEDSKDVYSPLLHQTKGIVFYSTPHRGSPIINNHITLLKAVFGFTPIIPELKNDSPALLQLNDDFLKLNPQPDVMCLGEELPMKAGKYEAVVVPPSSSKLDIGSFTLMKGTNHMTVCKPKDEK